MLITRNLWHSCGHATLADWRARMGPNARAFYDGFEQMIAACGEYHVAPAKTRIAFLAEVRFAGITKLNESEMVCAFALPKPLVAGGLITRLKPRATSPVATSRFFKIEEVVPNWWVHWMRITDVAQLDDEVQRWIRESYRLMGMRERLKGH